MVLEEQGEIEGEDGEVGSENGKTGEGSSIIISSLAYSVNSTPSNFLLFSPNLFIFTVPYIISYTTSTL